MKSDDEKEGKPLDVKLEGMEDENIKGSKQLEEEAEEEPEEDLEGEGDEGDIIYDDYIEDDEPIEYDDSDFSDLDDDEIMKDLFPEGEEEDPEDLI